MPNKTGEVLGVAEQGWGMGGEVDKVNYVPNHCQTVDIKAENLPINLN